MGGVKILNAGQSALKLLPLLVEWVGISLSSLEFLAPSTETYVKLAGAEIKSQQTVFTTLNSNTVKALGAGVIQNALEAAAFETAVQATMFKSPILKNKISGILLRTS
jgi:hypothetical protein